MNVLMKDFLLPDDLVLIALSFINAKDLVAFQSTCSRHRNLGNTNDLWKSLCQHRWKNWPLYASNELLNSDDTTTCSDNLSWKQRYRWVEVDYRRTELTDEDLEALEWNFNFLPWAGGSPNEQSGAYFHRGRLYLLKYLWMYPFLTYNIVRLNTDERGSESEQEGVAVARAGGFGDFRSNVDFVGGMELARGAPLRAAAETAGASDARLSTMGYLQISTFPIHYIARTAIGGWLFWNENVVFFSDGSPREAQLPDQLEIHLDMFRF